MGRGAVRDYAVFVLVDLADPDRDSHGQVDIDMTKTEIIDKLIECHKLMDEQGVPREGRYFKIPEDWLQEIGFTVPFDPDVPDGEKRGQ